MNKNTNRSLKSSITKSKHKEVNGTKISLYNVAVFKWQMTKAEIVQRQRPNEKLIHFFTLYSVLNKYRVIINDCPIAVGINFECAASLAT
jgi:hypothetical protein